jgi:hypothetical protein
MEVNNTERQNEGEHVRTRVAIEYQCCFSDTFVIYPCLVFVSITLCSLPYDSSHNIQGFR